MPLPQKHYEQLVQMKWHPETGEIQGESADVQTRMIFDNIKSILEHVGLGLESLTRIQCHLSDISHYEEFNAAYTESLGSCKPTRTVLGGYTLRDGALVELVAEGFAATLNEGDA